MMASRDYFSTALTESDPRPVAQRPDNDSSHDTSTTTVTVDSSEYASLLQISQEYKALRAALIAGGVPPENLDILINTPPIAADPGQPEWRQSPAKSVFKPVFKPKWSAEAPAFVPKANLVDTWRYTPQSTVPTSADPSCVGDEVPSSPPSHHHEEYFEEEEYHETSHEDRSLTLRGLSQFTTLADIVKHVKGGQVLNILKRAHSAHITFVDPVAAEKFLIFSKRADLYIRNKRVEVFWDDRQHYLPGHIARRISCEGATRNLVIRFPKPDMTVESIKEDLDHIHRLEIVSLHFDDAGHAFISTNSVNQALVARSCMSSRLKYKGTRIEFYPDECDQPLPPIIKKTGKKSKPMRPATISYTNRYAMLDALNSMEEDEGGAVLNGTMGRSVSAGFEIPVQ